MQQGKEEGAGGGWLRKAHKAGAQGQRKQEAEVDFANVSRQAQLVGMVGAHKQGKGPRAREEEKRAS